MNNSPVSKSNTILRQPILVIALVLLAALGIGVVALDWQNTTDVISRANWTLAPVALFFAAMSYVSASAGFTTVFQAYGIRIKRHELLKIGFVSITLDNIVSAGGAAGLSLRLLLLKQWGYETRRIVASSLIHSFLNNLDFLTLLLFGLVKLGVSQPLTTGQTAGIFAIAGVMLVSLIVFTVVVFTRDFRLIMLRVVSRSWYLITHRDIECSLEEFEDSIDLGMDVFHEKPQVLIVPMAFILSDWTATVLCLSFCFQALGINIDTGTLITGFAIGFAAGLISLLPAGLGIQDASMAGVFALFGVPFTQAVLASILFRLVYYFIPFGVSLIYYRQLLIDVARYGPRQ